MSEIFTLPDKDEEGEWKIEETEVNRLGEGRYFGEIGLISKMKRTATVRAKEDTILATLDRSVFEDI
jgi:CRP-like cAMP-binding protein